VEIISSRTSSVFELIDPLVEESFADIVEDFIVFLHLHGGCQQ